MPKGSELYYYRPWGVEENYEWIELRGELHLTNKVEVPPPSLIAVDANYVPVPSTALFRDFAALEPIMGNIERFVTRNGFLNTPGTGTSTIHMGSLIYLETSGGREHPFWYGESVRDWKRAIQEMKEWVTLWDLLQSNNRRAVKERFRWEGNKMWYTDLDGKAHYIFNRKLDGDIVWYHPDEIMRPAWDWLLWTINEKLKGGIPARLLWSEAQGRPVLCHTADHLLDAMWLQFARAIDGNKQYKLCPECGNAFEVHPEMARADKVFCSDACRMRAYRKRKSAIAG